MFVFLSKFLPLWLYPLGFVWLLLVLFLILSRKQTQGRKLRWIVVIAVIVIFLTGNRWTPAILARSLEWRYFPPEEMPANSMVVLLGGGTESRQYPRQMPEINGAGDRVLYTVKLYQDGVAGKILLSGGNISWSGSRTTTPALDMAELLFLLGVPQEKLILQEQSQNTAEDAYYSAAMLKEMGINKIILVTSASHMLRSVALFEKQGLEVTPAPADYTITLENWEALWKPSFPELLVGLVPSAENLSSLNYLLKEYLGFAIYRLRGWL